MPRPCPDHAPRHRPHSRQSGPGSAQRAGRARGSMPRLALDSISRPRALPSSLSALACRAHLCMAPTGSGPDGPSSDRRKLAAVALALFARVASTPPDVEEDDDEPLRSQGSSATPVGDDDDVSAALFCCTTRDCCSPLGCSALSVTRGALLAAFFALRKNDICQIACPAPQVQRLDCCRS